MICFSCLFLELVGWWLWWLLYGLRGLFVGWVGVCVLVVVVCFGYLVTGEWCLVFN